MLHIDGLPLEIHASEAAHALTHLARLSAEAHETGPSVLADLDDRAGETWQHLYGLTLDSDHTVDGLFDVIEAMDAVEFRRVLLGTTAWSWVNLLGAETLEAAVQGNAEAAQKLLTHERYYSGKAMESLRRVVDWDSAETKQHYLDALDWYKANHEGELSALNAQLAEIQESVLQSIEHKGVSDAIAEVTGYRYIAEPEAEGVALLIHGVDGSLCLAQHRGRRLIVHGSPIDSTPEVDIVQIGNAVGDANRARLLELIAGGPTDLAPLLQASDLARSTIHHHLSILRKAGLVEVEGNAGSYRYRIRPGAEERLLEAWKQLIDNPTER